MILLIRFSSEVYHMRGRIGSPNEAPLATDQIGRRRHANHEENSQDAIPRQEEHINARRRGHRRFVEPHCVRW
jgi:hypothetical protein